MGEALADMERFHRSKREELMVMFLAFARIQKVGLCAGAVAFGCGGAAGALTQGGMPVSSRPMPTPMSGPGPRFTPTSRWTRA
jgi:hypothetical protein